MDIKEIAEQVSKRIYVEDGLLLSKFISEKFAEALISAYKAELLKEVGEPVAYVDYGDRVAWNREKPVPETDLFTSDQVAAAILKATGPLEEEVERLNQQSANRLIGLCKCGEDNDDLRAQLAAAQEENDALRRIHKENIEILAKELSDKDYEYNQKTNRLIERHAEQLNRCDAEVKRLTGRKDGEVPNY